MQQIMVMSIKRKLVMIIIVCFGIMLLWTGCGNSFVSTEKNTLIYGSGSDTQINPALYEHGEINLLIFSGLTAHDQKNNIIPALADHWDYDEEQHQYTFYLRQDVLWHDGTEFSAEDVKFTLEAIMDPDNHSEIASNYEDITDIEVIDKHTISIMMKAPNVAMLDYLTIGILPKHLLDGKDLATDEFNQKPIGTGPYQLVEWNLGQSITLQRNEDYYGKKPEIERIIFKIVPDEKTRAIQLKSGELDLAQITPQDAQNLGDDFVVYNLKTADYRGILYNFNCPLFADNRELPAALSYAIDRQAIVDSVLLGNGEVAYSPLQMGIYHNPDIERYEYQPEMAKEQLERNGWKYNTEGIYEKNGQKLQFAINCLEGDQVRIDMATICAQQLREIGADVTVKVQAEIDWEHQETYLIGWGSPFDPDDHTYKVFGTQKGANYNQYSNQKVDELLQKARETDIDAERLEYYRQFQQELAQDPPFTFIAYANAIYAGKPNIQGITTDTVLGHHGVGIFWNICDWTLQDNAA